MLRQYLGRQMVQDRKGLGSELALRVMALQDCAP